MLYNSVHIAYFEYMFGLFAITLCIAYWAYSTVINGHSVTSFLFECDIQSLAAEPYTSDSESSQLFGRRHTPTFLHFYYHL